MKDAKLYKIEVGLLDRKAGDVQNWSSSNVIAKDVPEAIRRVKLRKSEYINGVSVIATVNVR